MHYRDIALHHGDADKTGRFALHASEYNQLLPSKPELGATRARGAGLSPAGPGYRADPEAPAAGCDLWCCSSTACGSATGSGAKSRRLQTAISEGESGSPPARAQRTLRQCRPKTARRRSKSGRARLEWSEERTFTRSSPEDERVSSTINTGCRAGGRQFAAPGRSRSAEAYLQAPAQCIDCPHSFLKYEGERIVVVLAKTIAVGASSRCARSTRRDRDRRRRACRLGAAGRAAASEQSGDWCGARRRAACCEIQT